MDRAEQLRIVAQLRETLEDAQASYDRATQHLKLKRELCEDLDDGHSGGGLLRALAVQDRAFEKYTQARFRLNCFILDGKLPDEDVPPE